jgi:hypothetical protein
MNDALTERYVVQSEQVRGERRSYWIEKHSVAGMQWRAPIVEDFGTNKRKAERRCDELNAALSLSSTHRGSE